MKHIPVSKIGFYRNPFNGVKFPTKSQAFSYMCRWKCLSFWRGHLKNDNRFLPFWQYILPAFDHLRPQGFRSLCIAKFYPVNILYDDDLNDDDLPF